MKNLKVGLFSAQGILCGKSKTSATIHGSSLFLTSSAGSHLPVGFPMDVGMPCGPFGSSRNGGGFLSSHMSILTLRLHAKALMVLCKVSMARPAKGGSGEG